MLSARLYLYISTFLCGVGFASVWKVSWWLVITSIILIVFISPLQMKRGLRGVVIFLRKAILKSSQHLPTSSSSEEEEQRVSNILPLVCLALFTFGIACFNFSEYRNKPLLDSYIGTTFSGKGIVIEEPEEKNYYNQVVVKVEGISKTQNIILRDVKNTKLNYGDEITFNGTLKKPESFKTDNGRVFDYPHYLAKDSIFYLMSTPHIKVGAHDKGSSIKAFLFGIKLSFIKHIQNILPRPESSLLAGLTVAGKDLLGVTLEDKYKKVGLIHVVVLSGYNVTIVAEALVALLSFLPRLISYSFGALGIILFSILAGGSSTIIRAAIMSIIALIGKAQYGNYNALRALMISATIMVFINPLILAYDPSFQLSFLATFGLIILSPSIQLYLERKCHIAKDSALSQIISATISTQLFLLPYLIYSNGLFSIVALPANLLVVSLVPFTMLVGFLAAFLSYFSLTVSYLFSFTAFILLRYQLRIVDIFSHIPFASIKIKTIPLWIVFISYAIFLIILNRRIFFQQRSS